VCGRTGVKPVTPKPPSGAGGSARGAKRGANDGARCLDADRRGLQAVLVLQVPAVGAAAAVRATEVNGARFARDLVVVASGKVAGDPLQHESTRLLVWCVGPPHERSRCV